MWHQNATASSRGSALQRDDRFSHRRWHCVTPPWCWMTSKRAVYLLPPTTGSSTDVSEDWEKDFDLDMTEEEVQMALSKIEASGEVGVTFYQIVNETAKKKFENLTPFVFFFCVHSSMKTGRTGTERLFFQHKLCPPAPSHHHLPAINASSRQTNHAWCVLSLCPHCHHVMIVSRGVFHQVWTTLVNLLKRGTWRPIRIWLLRQFSADRSVREGKDPGLGCFLAKPCDLEGMWQME